MLIEFRVANHRSLRDEQVLTMEAGRVGDESDPRPRRVAGASEKLLTVAALYGANASGKSNVLAALSFMRDAVVMSHRLWSPDEGGSGEPILPRDPFAWGPQREEPSLFEVTFLVKEVRYQYGFRASDDEFLEEWFFAWPSGKKQVWFERENGSFKFGENLKGENKTIEAVTRPNALFLSAAVQHKHAQLAPIYAWFQTFETIHVSPTANLPRAHSSFSRKTSKYVTTTFWQNFHIVFDKETELSEEYPAAFRELLKQADIGIVDVRVDKRSSFFESNRIYLRHQSNSDAAWLPLENESRGTQTLFNLASPVLKVLANGGLLVIDELERSLHPNIARKIVERFNDPAANPHNAQIIFTTHDTNLLGTSLGEPALRRDQVWLTEKDDQGATVLYPLTDYKPRNTENLERGYLQGRYGAIPFLDEFLAAAE